MHSHYSARAGQNYQGSQFWHFHFRSLQQSLLIGSASANAAILHPFFFFFFWYSLRKQSDLRILPGRREDKGTKKETLLRKNFKDYNKKEKFKQKSRLVPVQVWDGCHLPPPYHGMAVWTNVSHCWTSIGTVVLPTL